jgi:hypothetical protein
LPRCSQLARRPAPSMSKLVTSLPATRPLQSTFSWYLSALCPSLVSVLLPAGAL